MAVVATAMALSSSARASLSEQLGVRYRGPVSRPLDAGADSYLASTTIPHLATQLDHAVARLNEIAAPTSTPLVLDVPHEQNLLEG